jgi:hypothetical protein
VGAPSLVLLPPVGGGAPSLVLLPLVGGDMQGYSAGASESRQYCDKGDIENKKERRLRRMGEDIANKWVSQVGLDARCNLHAKYLGTRCT